MRTLAIGDIHGCHSALRALLARVQPGPADRLVFLGDYIDRGPASREAVDTLLELRNKCMAVFLRGNHEVMILDARFDVTKTNLWLSYGGTEALASYGIPFGDPGNNWVEAIPAAHWDFFERTERFFEDERNIFVHACLDPELEMREQPDWLLFWEYFDRLQPHVSGKRIVCGHSQQRSGRINDKGFAACVDTAPASGGWLTCLDSDTGHYWQANDRGALREGNLHLELTG